MRPTSRPVARGPSPDSDEALDLVLHLVGELVAAGVEELDPVVLGRVV